MAGFLLLGMFGVVLVLVFVQPCFGVFHCVSPGTIVTLAEAVVMGSLTFLIFITYRNQTGIFADQRDIAQAELRPKLDPKEDFSLMNNKPSFDKDDRDGSPSDWFGITVKNRGNEMAEYIRLILLVDIGDTDEPLQVSSGGSFSEEIRYASSIQDLNDARADVQTNRERPATVFSNSGEVELQTTLAMAKEQDGELIKSPFIDSLRKIFFEAEQPKSVTFGFVLAYQDSNGRWLADPLRPAYKLSPDDAVKIKDRFSLESVVDEASDFPMEDLYPLIDDLKPLNEYYARFRSNRERSQW